MTTRGNLAALRRLMVPGAVVDITNHYIERPDHPCFGTTRRKITAANSSSWSYFEPAHNSDHSVKWPKASDVVPNEDGSFDIYGHPKAGDLFLTIHPVVCCSECGEALAFDDIAQDDGLCLACHDRGQEEERGTCPECGSVLSDPAGAFGGVCEGCGYDEYDENAVTR